VLFIKKEYITKHLEANEIFVWPKIMGGGSYVFLFDETVMKQDWYPRDSIVSCHSGKKS